MPHFIIVFLVTLLAVSAVEASELEQAIEKAAGTAVTEAENGVLRIGWVRDDVTVKVDGKRLSPPAGLGSWAAFKPAPDGVIMMGDTVVFEDEIAPAMDAAFAHDLKVTALHNHFVFDDPPVYFMHIGGSGDPGALASGVKAVWEAIRSVRRQSPEPQRRSGQPVSAAQGTIDAEALAAVLEVEPTVSDGVVKFTFPREGRMNDTVIGGSMGVASWAAFSGDTDLASVDGDFVMTGDEVQRVMHALREHGIQIVALHNHMIGEEPRFYFLHFWGTGPAADLAAAISAVRSAQARSGGSDD